VYDRINFWTTVMPRLTRVPLDSPRFETPVATRPDRLDGRWQEARWQVPPRAPHLGAKLAFLEDSGSISQMELWLDIVRHHHLGVIVGEPSAGTDGEIDYDASYPYRFIWTGMKVTKHDGSRSHGIGIAPDLLVHRTVAGVRAGHDEILEAAVEALAARR
jgi:C-terminal processing protease CtpA/Prc